MIEIDGPKRAYFERPDGTRYSYEVRALYSNDPVKLIQMYGSHMKEIENTGILVWRRRPEMEWEEELLAPNTWNDPPHPARWKLSYRYCVVPFDKYANFIPIKLEGQETQIENS